MNFFISDYDTYFLLGSPEAPPLWRWDKWTELLPALDPLVACARGKPAVRSNQYLPGSRNPAKFGQIGWNDKAHQKWTHGSPGDPVASRSRTFWSVEMWAPGWTKCVRED